MYPPLSVFFPCYNEEKNIKATVARARKILSQKFKVWEIILINDGSKDDTGKVIDSLAKSDPRIKAIHHPKNRGYGAALKTGLYNSKYSWIAFTDADGQFDFAEISNFFSAQKSSQADMVIGYYLKRQVPFYRKFNSFAWQVVVYLLFGLNVRDIDCGFKLISKKIVDSIPALESERGAFISSEFLIKSKKAGFKIIEIGVHHYPRVLGKGTGADLNVIIKSFVDLFRLWFKLR